MHFNSLLTSFHATEEPSPLIPGSVMRFAQKPLRNYLRVSVA